jgi:hypothetical protein
LQEPEVLSNAKNSNFVGPKLLSAVRFGGSQKPGIGRKDSDESLLGSFSVKYFRERQNRNLDGKTGKSKTNSVPTEDSQFCFSFVIRGSGSGQRESPGAVSMALLN